MGTVLTSLSAAAAALHVCRCRGRGGAAGGRGGPAYIKISEAEIADDYPMPKQYKVGGFGSSSSSSSSSNACELILPCGDVLLAGVQASRC
jgi:hypothetical protein